jgi:hypothetical protein
MSQIFNFSGDIKVARKNKQNYRIDRSAYCSWQSAQLERVDDVVDVGVDFKSWVTA